MRKASGKGLKAAAVGENRAPMTVRDRTLAAGACVVALSLLPACGEPAAGARDPAGPRPALSIAAASDLRYVLDELVAVFRDRHPGTEVAVSYGSSGSFYAQVLNGAPFDLYLSADIDYARRLIEQGVAWPDSLFTYADGRLIVWVRSSSPLDVEARGLSALTDRSVTRVAMANPEHAPYGRAAEAALRSAGLYDAVKPKLVLGDNVSQALQFVESGAAQAGLVALALVLTPPVAAAGRYAVVPAPMHPRLEQGGVIVKSSTNAEAAGLFRAFMLSAAGQAVFDRYGFVVPR